MNHSRFVVGIDLGTTNIALAYCDLAQAVPEIRIFPIPQLIASGEVRAEKLYPSACWLPAADSVAPQLLGLPWQPEATFATGVLARKEGSLQPNRYISSAKSWLCHAGVDRRKPILPWNHGGPAGVMSPLETTTLYLAHLRDAWNHEFGNLRDADGEVCRLETQQTIITIPASFDETARELTLAAATAAGLRQVTLQEEPLAAFYAWLHRHAGNWQEKLSPGTHILVIDIGGGTTDFSLINYGNDGVLSRTAAGEHLLLGGDNIDLALAKTIEQEWQIHLSQDQWSALCQQTRAAKEKLLSDETLDSVKVTLLARGSSVIGGARSATVKRETLSGILNDGFFPSIAADAPAPTRKSGIQTMGLPYAADPAVTRHLLDFLRHAAHGSMPLRPEYLLYNGGSVLPESLRRHLTGIISSWFPDRPAIPVLTAVDLELAVAQGAAAAALAGRGHGQKVKCGTARSYYIETAGADGKNVAICVMPHGTEENIEIDCGRKFILETNRKAEFPLYSSAVRTDDRSGDTVTIGEELSTVSRMNCVLRFGNHEHHGIDTTLACRLTETGLLQLEVRATESNHRWPLHFDTRVQPGQHHAPKVATSADNATVIVNREQLEQAAAIIRSAFGSDGKPAAVTGALEQLLELTRKEWPLPLLRELADVLLKIDLDHLKNHDQESRWLNLTGFCLRPGFGDPADELRLKILWKYWPGGSRHPKNPQAVAEWWVCWRRVAPGLNSGQQRSIFHYLAAILTSKGQYQAGVGSPQEKSEMWRCLGALELLPTDQKIRVGKMLMTRGAKLTDAELWTVGRLGARRLFRAPANHVIPASIAAEWVEQLLKESGRNPFRLLALHLLAAATGDRALDLSPDERQQVKEFLKAHQAPEHWLFQLEQAGIAESDGDRAKILGDPLPLGLRLTE